MSRLRELFDRSSSARNLIQNPDLIRTIRDGLGLRQEHVTPTLNEGVQSVIIAGDLTKNESPAGNPVTSAFVSLSAGGTTQQIFALNNPRGNPASTIANTSRLTNIMGYVFMTVAPSVTCEFYLIRRADLDTYWGAKPRTSYNTSSIDTRRYGNAGTLGPFSNQANSDLQSVENVGDLGAPAGGLFLGRWPAPIEPVTNAFTIPITWPGLVLEPGWSITWRQFPSLITVPASLHGVFTYVEEPIQ